MSEVMDVPIDGLQNKNVDCSEAFNTSKVIEGSINFIKL